MKTGWINDNNTWYYLNNSGAMSKGMINVNNISYYLDDSGKMLANTTVNVNGNVYNIDASGAMTPAVKESVTESGDSRETSSTAPTQSSIGPRAK